MRPPSILSFERWYLASIGVALLQQILGLYIASSLFDRTPPGLSPGAVTAIFAAGGVIGLLFYTGTPLVLWYLAARRRIEVAKWIILGLSVLSIANLLLAVVMLAFLPLTGPLALQPYLLMIDTVAEALGALAIYFLLRPDATAWFRGQSDVDAEVFR